MERMSVSRRKLLIIGAAAGIGVIFLAILFSTKPRTKPEESSAQFELRKTLNEEALRAGEVERVMPTIPPDASREGPHAIRRVETETGQTVVFGQATALQDLVLSVNYLEGEENLVLNPESTVFSLSPSGGQESRGQEYLRRLQYPQIASVSFDASTKEIISVTIYETK
jgi:hypothetical protein